jgi:hypothetical protein
MATDPILERIVRLERSQRRLRGMLGALVVGVGAIALLGAADDGVLRGRGLQLKDDQDRVRVMLSAQTGLSLLGPDGAPRAVLGLDGSGPGLVLYGTDSRAILNINQDGPALAFTAARGSLRAVFASVRGEPGLVFYDAEERERLQFAVRGGGAHAELRGDAGDALWRVPD